jgi:hypothetical protein
MHIVKSDPQGKVAGILWYVRKIWKLGVNFEAMSITALGPESEVKTRSLMRKNQ